MEFTEEKVMCTEKYVLVKNIYKEGKYGLAIMNSNWKNSPWNGNSDSSVKKMFWMQQLVKKVMLCWQASRNINEPINFDFLEKSASNFEALRNVESPITLLSFPGPLRPGVVVPILVPFLSLIDLFENS